jgi:hypothetical protein
MGIPIYRLHNSTIPLVLLLDISFQCGNCIIILDTSGLFFICDGLAFQEEVHAVACWKVREAKSGGAEVILEFTGKPTCIYVQSCQEW